MVEMRRKTEIEFFFTSVNNVHEQYRKKERIKRKDKKRMGRKRALRPTYLNTQNTQYFIDQTPIV